MHSYLVLALQKHFSIQDHLATCENPLSYINDYLKIQSIQYRDLEC